MILFRGICVLEINISYLWNVQCMKDDDVSVVNEW